MILLPGLAILGLIWMGLSRLGWERQIGALRALAFTIRRNLPLDEALVTLARETGGKVGRRCRKAHALAETGLSPGEALAGLFALLPRDLAVGIQAGAGSGALAASLEEAAGHLERRAERRAGLALQFLYPCVLGLACAFLTAFQMIFILPKFTYMFLGFDVAAGPSVDGLPLFCLVPFLLILLGLRWAAAGRDPWAVLAGALSAAIRSGTCLPARMGEIAARGPRRLRERARLLAEGLRDGRALPDLLDEAGAPAVLRWLAKVGVRTGEPAQALAQASDLMDVACERRRGQALVVLPPLVVLSEAVVVGWIAWTILGSLIALAESGVLW